jgi:hypothetical protein
MVWATLFPGQSPNKSQLDRFGVQLICSMMALVIGACAILIVRLFVRTAGDQIAIVVDADSMKIPHMVTGNVHHVRFDAITRVEHEDQSTLKVTYQQNGRRRVVRITAPLAGSECLLRVSELLIQRGLTVD